MKKLGIAIAAASAAFLAVPAAANVLVVRSSGPSAKAHPPGQSLPDAAQVTLRPGDVLVLLGGQATRTLRGPGTFAVGNVGGAKLALAGAGRRGRFSAMRTGEVPAVPSVWHLDVSQSGTVCYADTARLQLWRPDAAEKVSLTLAPADGSAQTVEWPAGQDALAWPERVSVAADARYEVRWTGGAEASRLTFKALGSAPQDEQALAQALIAKGCQNQLDTLLETVPDEGAAGGK
jgi:hypothetical protein